jgi:uncharacterized protein (TIGR02266 family)
MYGMLIEILLPAVADPNDAEGTERDDMAQETRKGKRAPAALRVRFRAGTVEEFIEQQSPNISSGGMFIKSKSPLARGTLMVFDFQLQDGSPLIKGVGRVVWARKPEAAGKEPPGMGIKFIRVEPESLPTFQKIMAGKKPSGDSKDVVVRLGESDDISPIPAPESMPTPVSEPSPDKIAETKIVDADVAEPGEGAQPATPVPVAEPAPKKEEAKPAEKPAETPVGADLRATPRFDSVPTDLIRETQRQQAEAKPEAKPEAKTEAKPVIDELSRPIKVLGEGKAPAVKDDGSTLANIFDSSPSEMAKDGARPLAGAMTPMPVKVLTPDNSPRIEPKLAVPAKGPADEGPRKSPVGIIVAILIVLVVAAGGYVAYLYASGQLGGLVGEGETPATPERPANDTTNVVTPVPVPAAPDAAPTPGPDAAPTPTPVADAAPTPAPDAAPTPPAADAAPASASTRTVEIMSEPSGAPVTFNDRPVGRTPITLTSAEYQLDQRFTIQLSKRGHQNWIRNVEPSDPEWGPAGGPQRLVVRATLIAHDRPEPEDGGSGHRGGDADGGAAPPSENPPPQDATPPAASTPDSNPY